MNKGQHKSDMLKPGEETSVTGMEGERESECM